jgi:hypothetical protein
MKRGKVKENSPGIHSEFKIQNSELLKRDVCRLIFLNADKNPVMVPVDKTGHRVNFFKGRDPSKWRAGISTSRAVLYKNLYRRIDLKVYGIEKQVEYDFIIRPGGNPGDIRFEYKHVKRTRPDDEGNLLIETELGEWVHKKPVGYQRRKQGAAHVKVKFKKIAENTYGFEVGDYDKRRELIIDPVVLTYSTYLGGEDMDMGLSIAVDSKGNAYITGDTDSIDFPQKNPLQEDKLNFYYDVFAAKIGNFVLTLQLSRREERAWLIRKQVAEILLTVDNPGDIPVSN